MTDNPYNIPPKILGQVRGMRNTPFIQPLKPEQSQSEIMKNMIVNILQTAPMGLGAKIPGPMIKPMPPTSNLNSSPMPNTNFAPMLADNLNKPMPLQQQQAPSSKIQSYQDLIKSADQRATVRDKNNNSGYNYALNAQKIKQMGKDPNNLSFSERMKLLFPDTFNE